MSIDPTSLPFISVIIPTYNRHDSLLCTLQTLDRQTYPPERFEVIVVDDGGSDGTAEVTRQSYSFQLCYVHQANQGAAVARNRGAAEAHGDLLIFLDDDITVTPQFIESFEVELAYDRPTIAVGVLRPPQWQERQVFRDLYAQITATGTDPDIAFTDCLSGIFAVKREHFWQVGGMQDVAGDGRTAWGDVDFGYRAHQLGYRFRRAAGAIGYHDDRAIQNLVTYCRIQEKASQQAVHLFQKYSDLKVYIPMFRDKSPVSWREDPPTLIVRKLARQVVSSRLAMWAMKTVVSPLERCAPGTKLLALLYRWIVSAHIYRGYRVGLREAARKEAGMQDDLGTP